MRVEAPGKKPLELKKKIEDEGNLDSLLDQRIKNGFARYEKVFGQSKVR